MDDPLTARPVPGGSPPIPDGHTVPQPPRPPQPPPLTRREIIYGVLCVAITIAAIAIGVLR